MPKQKAEAAKSSELTMGKSGIQADRCELNPKAEQSTGKLGTVAQVASQTPAHSHTSPKAASSLGRQAHVDLERGLGNHAGTLPAEVVVAKSHVGLCGGPAWHSSCTSELSAVKGDRPTGPFWELLAAAKYEPW